jgi:2-deoxy-D-gluconate 3-dehydrogenase
MTTIFDAFKLEGRVAVVTGGAGLLGREFSRTLAEAGAAVVVADIQAGAAEAVAADLTAQGYLALGVRLDVTDPASVQAMVETTLARFGRLDILVNSAALDPKFDPEALARGIVPGRFEDFPLDLWNQALAVNLTGVFLVTQACVQPMLAQGKGSIINICSTYGLNGPDQRIYVRADGQRVGYKPVYYTVTKAGVLALPNTWLPTTPGRRFGLMPSPPAGSITSTMRTSCATIPPAPSWGAWRARMR